MTHGLDVVVLEDHGEEGTDCHEDETNEHKDGGNGEWKVVSNPFNHGGDGYCDCIFNA